MIISSARRRKRKTSRVQNIGSASQIGEEPGAASNALGPCRRSYPAEAGLDCEARVDGSKPEVYCRTLPLDVAARGGAEAPHLRLLGAVRGILLSEQKKHKVNY